MKNNFITKIIGASLAIAMMIGVGAGVNALKEAKMVYAADTTISSGDVVSGSGYKEHKTSNWIITFGGNNYSVGTNSNNRSKCNLNSQSKYAVSPVTTSDTASAFVSLASLNDINGITYTFSGGSNQTATKVYAIYSSNNTTFTALSLTSGTQGHTISTNTTLEFATCSGYFGLLFQATNDSGNWRIDNVNLTFHEDSNTAPAVTGIAIKTAPTKTAYWPGENFDPTGLVITVAYNNDESVDVAYDEHKSNFEWEPETITEAGNVEIQYSSYSEMKVTQAVTLVTPLTVAQAKNAIDAADNNTVPNAYVQGIISQIDGYNDSYHSITYWISDDGTASNQFEVYSGKGLNGANFASVNDIELGATVVVYGTMKLYGQNPAVYEFTQNSRLKSYTEPVKTLVSISLSGNFKTAYYTSESLSTQGLVVTAKYDNGSTKDVTDQAVISDPATAQARRSSVTVSYTEGGVTKTASYRIVARTRIQSRFNPFNGETVTEGDYIIYYNGRVLKNTIANNRASFEEITLNGSTYYTTNDSIVWHIAKDGDYYTIYNAAIKKYLAATGSKNQAQFITDNTDDKAKWTITSPSAGEYEFENLARKNADSDPNNKWLRNNGNNGFACYATATGGPLTLYKEEARTEIENQVTKTSLSYQYTMDDGVCSYSHAAIRFTGSINVQTWKDLDSQYHIQGYGIMFAETSVLDVYGPSKTISSLYQPIRNYYSSVDECFVTSGGKQYLNGYVNKIKYFYTELADSESHPAQVGNEYGWNLYKNLDDSLDGASATALTTSYTAVAFIRTQLGELFFMNEESVSAGELAFRNLYNGTEFSNDEVRESMEQMACLDIAA